MCWTLRPRHLENPCHGKIPQLRKAFNGHFPGHICSWAKFKPGVKTSAGKNKGNGSAGNGNRDLGIRAASRELIAFAVRVR
jgi:hypothetical protein